MKYSTLLVATFFGMLRSVHAAPPHPNNMVALRYETNGVQIFNGISSQVIENAFGTNGVGLPFTGSNTYDFYSAPLAAAVTFPNNNKIAGVIYMTNAAPTPANDFSVSGSMLFYDYDPLTGVDTLLVQTAQPPQHPVHHRKLEHWKLNRPPGQPHSAFNIPAGHMLHIAVVIVLRSGDPGSFAQLVINGRAGASTAASFPKTISLPADWPTPLVVVVPSQIDSLTFTPDGGAVITGEGDPEATYLIQATSNLGDNSSWATLGSVDADIDGSIEFTDTDAVNHPYRYYRLATP
jgi:hypothetical protein